MYRLIIISLLFSSSVIGQVSDVNERGASFAMHGMGFSSSYGFTIYTGIQTDFSVNDKRWFRISAGMNNWYLNHQKSGQGTVNTMTFGIGSSFPIRKKWFLFQPGIHVVYMKQEHDLVGNGYVRFNGAGLKGIVKLGGKIQQFDIGLHIDLSMAFGRSTQSYSGAPPVAPHFGYSENLGLFLQYNLKK